MVINFGGGEEINCALSEDLQNLTDLIHKSEG